VERFVLIATTGKNAKTPEIIVACQLIFPSVVNYLNNTLFCKI